MLLLITDKISKSRYNDLRIYMQTCIVECSELCMNWMEVCELTLRSVSDFLILNLGLAFRDPTILQCSRLFEYVVTNDLLGY